MAYDLSDFEVAESPVAVKSPPSRSVQDLSDFEVEEDPKLLPTGVPELPYPEGLERGVQQSVTKGDISEAPEVSAPLSEQAKAWFSVDKNPIINRLASTGMNIASGFEAQRAKAATDTARQVEMGLTGPPSRPLPKTEEEREQRVKELADTTKATEKPIMESAKDFAETGREIEDKSPKGALTSVGKGIGSGLAMFATAEAGGIPLLATTGATEAYGSAKAAGKSDEQADHDAARTLLALTVFGGANKAVSSGIAKYLGKDAPALQSFLVQSLGQSAGNELTSRLISSYEAALDAPEGEKVKAAAEAAKKLNLESITQNIAFGVAGGAGALNGKPEDYHINKAPDEVLHEVASHPEFSKTNPTFSDAAKEELSNRADTIRNEVAPVLPRLPGGVQERVNTIIDKQASGQPLTTDEQATLIQVRSYASKVGQDQSNAEFTSGSAQPAPKAQVTPAEQVGTGEPLVSPRSDIATVEPTEQPKVYTPRIREAAAATEPLKEAASEAKETLPAAANAADELAKVVEQKISSPQPEVETPSKTGEQVAPIAEQERATAEETPPAADTAVAKPTEPGTKIVGPVLLDENGNILVKGEIGDTHEDLKKRARSELKDDPQGDKEAAIINAEHGFVDDKGNTLNRRDAWDLAENAGQIKPDTLDAMKSGYFEKALHSDNLIKDKSNDLPTPTPAEEPPAVERPVEAPPGTVERSDTETSAKTEAPKLIDKLESILAEEEPTESEKPAKSDAQKRVDAIRQDIENNKDADNAWKSRRRKDLKAAEEALKADQGTAPAEETPTAPAPEKELWQKTRDEVREEGTSLAKHRNAVKEAISQGKDVPLNVLESFSGNHWADKVRKEKYGEQVSDTLIDKILNSLKDENGNLYFDPLFIQSVGKPALRGAVKLIREGIEAGRVAKDVMTDVVNYIKKNAANADEQKTREFFQPIIDEALGKEESKTEEAAKESPKDESTSLKREVVDEQARQEGRQEIPTESRPPDEKIVEDAKARIEADPTLAKKLVADIVDDGKTGITRADAATLLAERRRIRNERKEWQNIAGDAESTSTQKGQAKTELKRIEEELFRLDQAGRAAGREWSDVGRMYQREIAADYSLDALERKARATKGGPLSEEQLKKLEEKAAKYEKMSEHLDELQEKASEGEAFEEMAHIYEQLVDEVSKEKKPAKAAKETKTPEAKKEPLSQSVIDFAKSQREAALERIRVRRAQGRLNALPVNELADYSIVGASYIMEGIAKGAKWTKQMVDTFGPEIKPFLKEIFSASEDQVEKLTKKAEKKPKTIEQTKARLKVDAKDGDALDSKVLADLVRAHIREGLTGENEVISAVHKDVQEFYPEATDKDVRRALVKYGSEVKPPTRDAVERRLSQLKSLVKVNEDIRNLQANPPEPTWKSQRREKHSDELRRAIAIRSELLKKVDLPESDSGLASRAQARETALANRIKDITRELETGEKPPEKAPISRTPREESLMMERDALQEKLNEVRESAKPKPTEADIASEKAQKGVDAAAAAMDRMDRILKGEIVPEGKTPKEAISDLEEELKSQTDAMRQAYREIKEAQKDKTAPGLAEQKSKLKALEKSISAYEKRAEDLRNGVERFTASKKQGPDTEVVTKAREARDAAKKVVDDLEKARKVKKTPEEEEAEKAQKGVDRAAAALDRWDRIMRGEIEPEKKSHLGPRSNLEEELFSQADALRRAKREMDKAAAAKTPDERYNETRMKQVEKAIAEAKDRLARRDYSPKPKPQPKQKTAEVAKAESDLRKLREDINRDIGQIAYEKSSKASRAAQLVNKLVTGIKVVGHGTVGMVTHAGGLLYRPEISTQKIWWQNFGRQFGMWAKPEFHEQLIHRLTSDKDFETWKNSGLSIDPETNYTDYGILADALKHLSEKAGKPGKAMANFLEGGRRGFDALKLARLELSKRDWDKVPEEIKADPQASSEMRRYIAEMNNKATGAIPGKVNPVGTTVESGLYNLAKNPISDIAMFAPRLYASRWARIVVDPIKTVNTFANWNNATPAERAIATKRLKNAALFTSGYIGALAVNQAILSATGSKQKVNILDPTKADWLKFKAFGKEIVADGGLLDPVRLLGQIVIGDLLMDKPWRGQTGYNKIWQDLGKYYRGKMNPTLGFVTDVATGKDYSDRPLPFPSMLGAGPEQPEKPGKPKYTWGEWLLQQGPIPLSGGTRVAYEELRKEGMSHLDAMKFLKAAAVSVLGMTGVHAGEDYGEQEKSHPYKRTSFAPKNPYKRPWK